MSNITRIATAVAIALVLALSLAGVSYYFPSTQDTSFPFSPSTGDGDILQPTIPKFSVSVVIHLPNITIKNDGTVEPQDAPIKRDGNYYTLTGDIINKTLQIQRDNLIVDGEGYKIQGVINAAEGILIQNRSNMTLKNIKIEQYWYGISVINSSNIIITRNRVANIGSRAITLNSCNNSLVSDNSINVVITAIEITETDSFARSTKNTVTRNTIVAAEQGITIKGSFITINENSLTNVNIPIEARGNQTTISKNNLENGDAGILIAGSYCTIFGNNVANFSSSGISINEGKNSTVYENTVITSELGIKIGGFNSTRIVDNNICYRNNFVNNTQNVFIGAINSRNIWELDNLGNYWSDYTGADKNGDAIGDIPYIVDKNNIDNYPLMTVYNTNSKLQSNHTLWVQLGIIGLVAFAVIIIGIWFFNRKKLIWP